MLTYSFVIRMIELATSVKEIETARPLGILLNMKINKKTQNKCKCRLAT
jgi:hypothetical protein